MRKFNIEVHRSKEELMLLQMGNIFKKNKQT